MVRVCLMLLGLMFLAGCGNRGPRPYPGDTVHVEGLHAPQLSAEPKELSHITLRFAAEAPGSSERVLLVADDIVALVQPQLKLRFYNGDSPLADELTLNLEREC